MVGCRTLELEHFRFFIVFIEMESSMNQKHMVASLLEKASKYREFARWIGDRETVQQILALAGELKQSSGNNLQKGDLDHWGTLLNRSAACRVSA
jgi:hypothetical protein